MESTSLVSSRFTVAPGSLSLLLADRNVLVFDGEGRPFFALLEGKSYRRGGSGRILEVGRDARGRRTFRDVEPDEGRGLMARALGVLGEWIESRTALESVPPGSRQLLETLRRERRIRSVGDLSADEAWYHRVYDRVGIIPPDDYLAVVLQVTSGCAYNRCGFCSFYRGTSYRVRNGAEFEHHVDEVRRFLGRGLAMRRRIWLGEASILGVAQPLLMQHLACIARLMPGTALRGIAAFGDMVAGRSRSAGEYRQLREAGLTSLSIGVESGSAEVRAHLGKHLTARPLDEMQRMREAGLEVTPILLLGAGGRGLAPEHEDGTISFLNRWNPGRGEKVYLSPLLPGSGVPAAPGDGSPGAMDSVEVEAQSKRIQTALPAVRFSLYDIRNFVH